MGTTKWITTTPGAVVDYEYIKTHIRNMEKIINLRLKKYVRMWNATQFMQDMEAEGYTMIEIRQGMATLSGPTKDFREQVYQRRLSITTTLY